MDARPLAGAGPTASHQDAGPSKPTRGLAVAASVSTLVAVVLGVSLSYVTRAADADVERAIEEAATSAEASRTQAFDEGVAAGRSEASASLRREHAESLEAERISGYNAGASAAYPSGRSDGYQEGYSTGEAEGYARGAADGYADGYAAGVAAEPELSDEERLAQYDQVLRCMIDPTDWICSQDLDD